MSLTVNKQCGIVEGSNVYNLGSNADIFLKKFGIPDKKSTSNDGKSIILNYKSEGIQVTYSISSRKITSFMLDLEVDPSFSLINGPRLSDSKRLLAKVLGAPVESNMIADEYRKSGCTIIVFKQALTDIPMLASIE